MGAYKIDWETAQGIVKATLREDARMLKKDIKRLESMQSRTSAQGDDLEMNKEILGAINVLRVYYGA